MTEVRGTAAGWRTAAVMAPVAAAALAMATGWALENQPVTEGSATPTAVAAAPARPAEELVLDRVDAALQQRALSTRARVVALTRAIARTQARIEAVRSAPLPGAGGSSGGSTVVRSPGSGGGSVPAPPAHPAAPAPAPASHTSTGAS